jgi:hypothetical protein
MLGITGEDVARKVLTRDIFTSITRSKQFQPDQREDKPIDQDYPTSADVAKVGYFFDIPTRRGNGYGTEGRKIDVFSNYSYVYVTDGLSPDRTFYLFLETLDIYLSG